MKLALFASALTVGSALCLFSLGCGSSGGGDCDAELEVEVAYLDGDRDGTFECAALPAECDAADPCGDTACTSALFDLCEAPYVGVGCSGLEGEPAIVSCNP